MQLCPAPPELLASAALAYESILAGFLSFTRTHHSPLALSSHNSKADKEYSNGLLGMDLTKSSIAPAISRTSFCALYEFLSF